jgi:uncharacterized membrane protein
MTVVMVTIVIYDIMKHYESVKGIDKVNKYISEGHYKYDLISWLGLMLFGIVHGGLVFSITATILLSLVVLLKIRFTKDKENSNASKKE